MYSSNPTQNSCISGCVILAPSPFLREVEKMCIYTRLVLWLVLQPLDTVQEVVQCTSHTWLSQAYGCWNAWDCYHYTCGGNSITLFMLAWLLLIGVRTTSQHHRVSHWETLLVSQQNVVFRAQYYLLKCIDSSDNISGQMFPLLDKHNNTKGMFPLGCFLDLQRLRLHSLFIK